MNRRWEAHTCLDSGFCKIVFSTGEELTVKNNGVDGFEFVEEYIGMMKRWYPSHLEAADQKLRQRIGRAYKTVKTMPRRYMAELALVSLNCAFGMEDGVYDCESDGSMTPEKVLCPERYSCPFNGYGKENGRSCCNPIYECGLTQVQARVADMMVNTPMSYEEMADKLGCSYSNIDNIRKRIFACLKVESRPELMLKLRGKRLV